MDSVNHDLTILASWKPYLYSAAKFLIIFYITTLCMIIFFLHRGSDWYLQGAILTILYLFVAIVSLREFAKNLPMAAIFLAAPIIPLCMLLLVITMIPLLQLLK